jgi:inorganic triphosphatase YgiF
MTIETELKLIASPRALQALPRLPWLRKISSGRARKQKLVSIYFDTPDCRLHQNGVALRIRRQLGKRTQTIKTADGGNGALARGEWDQPVSADRPNLDAAKHTPVASLLNGATKKTIKPVFETNIERVTIPLRSGHSEVELALDRGFIRAGKRRESVHEIELELKHGDPRDLVALAERCAGALSVSYGVLSKAERGFALSARRAQQPIEAGDIRLDAAQSTASAFAKIGLSCLHHFAANETAVRKGKAEGVHQMRVGLRRLRAAISVFREFVQGSETEAVKTELKWLTEQLGPARDLDVLVEDALKPLHLAEPAKNEIQILKSDVEDRRKVGFAQAKVAVESARYRKLVLDTALWLIAGSWSHTAAPLVQSARARPIDGFAPEVLRERTEKVGKKSCKADELDARGRHRLRIAVKKLRYSTEFFSSLFLKKKQKRARQQYAALLKALQEALGILNDIAVHDRFAGDMVRLGRCTRKELQKAYAMGLLSGSEHEKAAACVAAVKMTGKKLADAKPFWH